MPSLPSPSRPMHAPWLCMHYRFIALGRNLGLSEPRRSLATSEVRPHEYLQLICLSRKCLHTMICITQCSVTAVSLTTSMILKRAAFQLMRAPLHLCEKRGPPKDLKCHTALAPLRGGGRWQVDALTGQRVDMLRLQQQVALSFQIAEGSRMLPDGPQPTPARSLGRKHGCRAIPE